MPHARRQFLACICPLRRLRRIGMAAKALPSFLRANDRHRARVT